MRSSEVASRAGVNTQTLRYYERRGLLEIPPRSASGFRAYPAGAIRFIKLAQGHGFSLDQIEELLHLADGGPEDCAAARQMARTKMAELAGKIAELQRMRRSLAELAATCDLPRTERRCPMIRALYAE